MLQDLQDLQDLQVPDSSLSVNPLNQAEQAEINKNADKRLKEKKIINRGMKGIVLKDILENLFLTKSLSKTAKILSCSVSNISQRLTRANIDIDLYLDFKDTKAVHYESLQSRLVSSIKDKDLQKAPVGSKVLAVCQLEDKIRLIRGESTGNLSIHADLAALREMMQADNTNTNTPNTPNILTNTPIFDLNTQDIEVSDNDDNIPDNGAGA